MSNLISVQTQARSQKSTAHQALTPEVSYWTPPQIDLPKTWDQYPSADQSSWTY